MDFRKDTSCFSLILPCVLCSAISSERVVSLRRAAWSQNPRLLNTCWLDASPWCLFKMIKETSVGFWRVLSIKHIISWSFCPWCTWAGDWAGGRKVAWTGVDWQEAHEEPAWCCWYPAWEGDGGSYWNPVGCGGGGCWWWWAWAENDWCAWAGDGRGGNCEDENCVPKFGLVDAAWVPPGEGGTALKLKWLMTRREGIRNQ